MKHIILFACFVFSLSLNAQVDTTYYSEPVALELFKNEKYELAAPMLSHDRTRVYFTVSEKEKLSKSGELLHEIWYADLAEGTILEPKRGSKPFNNGYNSAVVGISNDGERIYLFGTSSKLFENEKGLSYTYQENGVWQDPIELDIPGISVNGGFYAFYVHPAEDVIVISMEHNGQEDIFLSTFDQRSQEWTPSFRLPTQINTEALEIAPFLSHDKQRLYFSRVDELGNTSIHYSERLNNSFHSWSTAKPLPEPINSSKFDAYFSQFPDGTAMFSSNRSGTGKLYFSHKIEEKFIHSPDPIEILTLETPEVFEPEVVLMEQPMSIKKHFLFYEFNSSTIESVYLELLDELTELMASDQNLMINIGGHSDYIDTEDFNIDLSHQRALNISNYLTDRGISLNRIKLDAYGEALPISNNDTADGRKLNRRVEIELTRFEYSQELSESIVRNEKDDR